MGVRTEVGNEQPDMSLFRHRGVARCLSVAVSWLTGHFGRLLWLTLPVALPMVMAVGGVLYVGSDASWFEYSTTGWWLMGGLAGVAVVAYAAWLSVVYDLAEWQERGADWQRLRWKHVLNGRWARRALKILFAIVMELLVVGVFVGLYHLVGLIPMQQDVPEMVFAKVAGYVVLAVLAVGAMVPMCQCVPSVALGSENNVFERMWRGYAMGWCKWGKVFALVLLAGIIVTCLLLMTGSPAIIMYFARHEAAVSLLQGDAVALPSGFAGWAAVLFVVSAYVALLLHMVNHLSQVYLYGSNKADADEAQRNKIPMM